VQGVERGMPAQRRTFDSGRESVHPGKRANVTDLFRFLAGRHNGAELLEKLLGFRRGFAFELSRHQRRAGLGNRAAGAVEGDLADAVAVEPEIHAALITAGGIVAMRDAIGGRQFPAIPRPAIVIQNNLLVEVGEVRGHGVIENVGKTPRSAKPRFEFSCPRIVGMRGDRDGGQVGEARNVATSTSEWRQGNAVSVTILVATSARKPMS